MAKSKFQWSKQPVGVRSAIITAFGAVVAGVLAAAIAGIFQLTSNDGNGSGGVTTHIDGDVTGPVITGNNVKVETIGISPEQLEKIVTTLLSENSDLAESLASSREEVGQLRERVTNAVKRAQEAEQEGDVEGIIKELQESDDTKMLLEFLIRDRDKHKDDLLERNREIAAIAYLRHDMAEAARAVDEILRLEPDDLDALIVKANVIWLTRSGTGMEQLLNHILNVATKKDDLEAQAGALANLGELYWGGSGPLPTKSVEMFKRAKELERKLAETQGRPYYDTLPEHIPPLVRGNLLEYERFYHEWVDGKRQATPEAIAAAHGHIGVVRLKKGDLDGAERWMLKAIEKYEHISPQSPQVALGIANQHGNLGIVFAFRKDNDRAKDYFLKARNAYARADPRIAARIHQWIRQVDASK